VCGGEDVTAVLVVPLQLSNVTEETTELDGMLQQLLDKIKNIQCCEIYNLIRNQLRNEFMKNPDLQ
jgi:hypothetical protein